MTMAPALVVCEICGGRKQTAPGVACPVCQGTGMSTPAQAAAHRQALASAAVASARRVVEAEAESAAREWVRGMAQSRQDAQEAAAQAREGAAAARAHAMQAHATATAQVQVILDAVIRAEMAARQAEAAASTVPALTTAPATDLVPVDPNDPPPFAPIPPGFAAGGGGVYMDSIALRQLDVWGQFSFPGGGNLLVNPMTTIGDLIIGGTGGSATRLPVGTTGQVLTVSGGRPAWLAPLGVPVAGPAAATPTVFQQPDGSMVVVPLSFYSISGDDSTWINTAFTFLPQIAGGSGSYGGNYTGPWIVGRVRLLAATYTITSGIVCPQDSGTTIQIEGLGAGTILMVGPGATGIYRHGSAGGPQTGVPALQSGRGAIRDLRIDGSNAGANSVGIDWGGGWGGVISNVQIVNFEGAFSIGLHVNNSVSNEWTEKTIFDVDLQHCTTAVLVEQTGGNPGTTDSMEYNDWTFRIMPDTPTGPAQAGVVFQRGVFFANGRLTIRGNFPANSGPLLSIQGNDGAGGNTSIFNSVLELGAETGASSNIPQTIFFGSAGNNIGNCFGKMTFEFGNVWTATNAAPGQIAFVGLVRGDDAIRASIAGVTTPAVPAVGTTVRNTTGCNVLVHIGGSGAGINVTLDGQLTGIGSGQFVVPANSQVGLGNAWTGTPTWVWTGVS